jgi:chorismate-pyruvate lyase
MSGSSRLATEALEEWYQQDITVELRQRWEATLLEVPPCTVSAAMLAALLLAPQMDAVQHRYVQMTVVEGVIGRAYSTVLLDRITPDERKLLTSTSDALGRCLQACGVRRRGVGAASHIERDTGGNSRAVVSLQTLLYRDGRPVAYAEEEFYSCAAVGLASCL